MTINWYGHSCFKLTNQGGHLTVIIDPFDKNIGLNPPRGNADIVLVSHQHDDHNNLKSISGQPFLIDGPGEYEVKGINITGLSSWHDNQKGKIKGRNTIYIIEIDKMRICHLGDLGQEKLTDSQLENIGQVDVLMIPVGGNFTIGASEAVTIIEQIEPAIVIPMHYKLPGLKFDLDSLDRFLKETGSEKNGLIDKLTLKQKDLVGKEAEVVVMKI